MLSIINILLMTCNIILIKSVLNCSDLLHMLELRLTLK